MGQLTNLFVSESYQGLIKLANSTTGVTENLQYLQDGLGNNLPIQVSSTEVTITGSISNAVSSSYAQNATSASQAENSNKLDGKDSTEFAITGSNTFLGDQIINGTLSVTGQTTLSGLDYPTVDGQPLQYLQTDGSGSLTFAEASVTAVSEVMRNGEATTILKGTPVYVSGSNGAVPIVYRADASDPNKMPAIYIANANINSNQNGSGLLTGLINGVDTTGFPAGTDIFVAPGGGYTATRPTGSAIIQFLGTVTKEGNGGAGVILNPGQALLPNLASDNLWLGNVDGVPTQVDKDTLGFATTSSLTSLSSSIAVTDLAQNGRLSSLETNSGSQQLEINQKLDSSSFNSYTSSNDGRVSSLESKTGSYATTGSNIFQGTQTVTGSLNVTGEITALSASITYLKTIYQTSSIVYSSGSNILGDEASDVQTFWGKIEIPSGPVNITGSLNVTGNITGNLIGNASTATSASQAQNSVSSSEALHSVSSSHSTYSETAGNSNTAVSSSEAQHAVSSSYSLFSETSVSSSEAQHAVSASYAPSNPLPSGLVSGSSQISYTGIIDVPNGIVSGSSQISNLGYSTTSSLDTLSGSIAVTDLSQDGRLNSLESVTSSYITSAQTSSMSVASSSYSTQALSASYAPSNPLPSGLVSGSSQISYTGITNVPSGIISGSSQVSFTGITDVPSGLISGSSQISGLGFATTGSNIFLGTQTITGSLTSTGNIAAGVYVTGSTVNVNARGNLANLLAAASSSARMRIASYNNAFTYDSEVVISANPSGSSFADWDNGTAQAYKQWLTLASNVNNDPLPQFKRGVGITGSLNVTNGITGSFSGDGSGLTGITATLPSGVVSGSAQVSAFGFATTGSNTFVGNQIIDGTLSTNNVITGKQLILTGGTGTDLVITGSGTISTQLLVGPAGGNSGYMSEYAVSSFNQTTYDELGFTNDGASYGIPNWNGPSIYGNDPSDTYPAFIGFQNKSDWTDGRITVLQPLVTSGTTIMNSPDAFPLYVNGTINSKRLHFTGNPFNTDPAPNLGALRFDGTNTQFYLTNYDNTNITTQSIVGTVVQTGSNFVQTFLGANNNGTNTYLRLTNDAGVGSLTTNVDMVITGSLDISGDVTGTFVGDGSGLTDLVITEATFTVELMDALTTDFYAPGDLEINTVTPIVGTPTTTIEVNNSAYTLGDTISQGDKITVEVDTNAVLNLSIQYV